MLDAVREAARPHYGDAPAHDWSHVERVTRLARRLHRGPTDAADEQQLLAAVALHDIGRDREARGEIADHAVWGADRARSILTGLDWPDGAVDSVVHCVRSHRYSSGPEPASRAARLLSDADNLDAMGAVGIARCFAHGGEHRDPMHGPATDPAAGGQLEHVHAKLLRLRDRMYTDAGRSLAAERHEFLEGFTTQFAAEVRGER